MKRGKHRNPGKPLVLKFALGVLLAAGLILFAGTFSLIGIRAFAIESKSMEPGIHQGSIVITSPATSPAEGDVVTYEHPENSDLLITHRIVDVQHVDGDVSYVTKGDANDDADEDPIAGDHIVGEIRLSIPWLGSMISWARTDLGFILLIIVPATIIIYHEVLSLGQQLSIRRSKRRSVGANVPRSGTPLPTTARGRHSEPTRR